MEVRANNIPQEASTEGASFNSDFEINEEIKKGKSKRNKNGKKTIYNAVELMSMDNTEQQYLMTPIVPIMGTGVLAGKPDIGKSQLARQLCIQIALGLDCFIGFKLSPIHNRSIYISTEDYLDNTKASLEKQLNGLGVQAKENIRFMFPDNMDQAKIIKKLDEALKKEPADLVVVDSFGDIFKGGDTNNNMAMRNTVKSFDKIAKKHKCLILFVHHINKASYKQSPGQQNIQGGAGLVQKVRFAIQLSEGEGDIRYLTVTKGNYCPKTFKDNSLVLAFSEETLLFSSTGKMKPTADIGSHSGNGSGINAKVEKDNKLEALAIEIFTDLALTRTEFIEEYCSATKQSAVTGGRVLNKLSELKIVEKFQGKYRLINPIAPEEIAQDNVSTLE